MRNLPFPPLEHAISLLKKIKFVSHTLEKFLKRKRDDDNSTDSQPEKTAVTQPANSQLEEITEQTNAENDNLLDALPEEMSSTAPSISLTQSLEQITEMLSCSSLSSDMAHVKKDRRVAIVKEQQLVHLEFYYCVVEKGCFCKTYVSFFWNKLTWSTIHYQSLYMLWPPFTKKHWSFAVWASQGSRQKHTKLWHSC